MNSKNPKVDFYFSAGKWQEELKQLRNIILDCGLVEELKWGVPCYTFQKNNVLLIHVFKEYCAILFVRGALLQDVQGLLIQQSKQVQAARQIRFTDVGTIVALAPQLQVYIHEAIALQQAGLKVPLKKTSAYPVPEEFQKKLKETPGLKTAFEKLTPGRQRGYLLYFAQPKQSVTRTARIGKSLSAIWNGKGLNDQ